MTRATPAASPSGNSLSTWKFCVVSRRQIIESVSVSPHDCLPGLTIDVFLLYMIYLPPPPPPPTTPSSLQYYLDTGPPIYSQLNMGVGRKEERQYSGYLLPLSLLQIDVCGCGEDAGSSPGGGRQCVHRGVCRGWHSHHRHRQR